MCGATAAQNELQAQQAQFYSTLTSEYSTVFGENQSILNNLTSSLTPILKAGINQQGFSAGELSNLNSQAETGTGANYAQAKAALAGQEGAEGGGNTFIPSGAKNQLNAQLAESGAAEASNLSSNVLASDYATGRQNYLTAASALGGVASELNPEGMAGAATGAGSAEGVTANQIDQAGNSWMSLVGAGIGAAGSAFSGGATKAIFG